MPGSVLMSATPTRSKPGIATYVESWAMSLVEDVMRTRDTRSSEEIVLFATKPRAGDERA